MCVRSTDMTAVLSLYRSEYLSLSAGLMWCSRRLLIIYLRSSTWTVMLSFFLSLSLSLSLSHTHTHTHTHTQVIPTLLHHNSNTRTSFFIMYVSKNRWQCRLVACRFIMVFFVATAQTGSIETSVWSFCFGFISRDIKQPTVLYYISEYIQNKYIYL